ncbi:MAG: tyrosine-type recombinase/integrase [Nocardioidaceae bacterium]
MRGHERSAGTFSNRKNADKAWQMTEATFAAGRPSDPRRGRMTFTTYLETIWFPNHVLEPSTRQSYRYLLEEHILPTFGPMRMSTILQMHVREWVIALSAAGVSPAMIRHNKIVLSAIFTTALNDLVIALHPCKGVKSPTVPVKEYRILTPTEYDLLQTKLPLAAQLLVETAIDSGLRWGELTELRPSDLNLSSGVLTVSRAVVELQPQFDPSSGRFLVKHYPKGRRSRRFKLNPLLVTALKAHAKANGLGPGDLLFSYDLLTAEPPASAPLASADTLGRPNPTTAAGPTSTAR